VAPDGTIEAVSVADAPGFAVGVQWHPEFWVASDAPSARLFRAFGEAMRERMSRGSGLAAAE
jgi:putative glutamine amidotransferase